MDNRVIKKLQDTIQKKGSSHKIKKYERYLSNSIETIASNKSFFFLPIECILRIIDNSQYYDIDIACTLIHNMSKYQPNNAPLLLNVIDISEESMDDYIKVITCFYKCIICKKMRDYIERNKNLPIHNYEEENRKLKEKIKELKKEKKKAESKPCYEELESEYQKLKLEFEELKISCEESEIENKKFNLEIERILHESINSCASEEDSELTKIRNSLSSLIDNLTSGNNSEDTFNKINELLDKINKVINDNTNPEEVELLKKLKNYIECYVSCLEEDYSDLSFEEEEEEEESYSNGLDIISTKTTL